MIANEIAGFQKRWAERIGKDALAKSVISTLWREHARHIAPVLEHSRAHNPIIDPVQRSEPELMARHTSDHFRALLALAGPASRAAKTPQTDDHALSFVVQHAVHRAQGGVPLRAVLQAYRAGHKAFWSIMCRAIDQKSTSAEAGMRTTMLLSDYCIEYTDLISVVLTDAYVAEEARLTYVRTRLSIAVLEELLIGQAPAHEDGLALCRAKGLADGRAMVVAVAQAQGLPPNARLSGRDQARLAAALKRRLDSGPCLALVEPRQDQVVALCSAGEQSQAGAAVVASLRQPGDEELQACLRFAHVGVGLDVQSLADLPRAHEEALLALQLEDAAQPVAHLAEVDVNTYLCHVADATARRLVPALPAELHEGILTGTLKAFAAADLNVKACARSLGVHTNTIYHRLNRIQRLTGRDPRNFYALGQLMTALALSARTSNVGRPPT